MFHLITLLSSLLWRRPVVETNVSDIHSDDAATGKGQSVTEEAVVASSSHSDYSSLADVSGTSVDSDSKSEDIFANLSDSKKEKDDNEISKVEEEPEPCLIDLTTLLPQEEKPIEDDICITKVTYNKSPLAELMAKRKKNKDREKESKKTDPSSPADSPDIFLKDLVRRSREYAEKRLQSRSWSRGSSEKKHYSGISEVLSDKKCCEEEVQIDENSNLGLWSRSESPTPPSTDEKQCDDSSKSPTCKRKKEPHKDLYEELRTSFLKKPSYSETTKQPRGKRKKRSSSIEDVVIVSDISSSSSEQNSPSTSKRKKHKQTFTRKWEWSDFGLEHKQKRNEYPGMEFSIMSYNLLAQDLLELHPHLYTHSDRELLDWEYRRARLLEEIEQHLPDILCFQEVQCDHYEDFLTPKLEARGYIGIYCKKSGAQTDGCATFFKVMKFDLLSFRQVFYQKGEVLDRGNVGLIVGLKPKASAPNLDSCELYVANTHLLFNPKRGDVKLAQLILFLAELDKAAYKCHKSSNKIVYHPTILCGDFNLEPFCRIYKLIVSRYMRYEGLLIRTLAGTSEYHYGRDYLLSKNFFPSYLDITNFCQFAETVKERNLKEATKLLKDSSPMPAEPSSENTKENPSSENKKENPSDSAEPENSRPSPAPSNEISPPPGMEEMLTPLNSGEVSHFFNFVSTYEHEIRYRRHRRMEVTSYHNLACGTMDYIFYSVDKKAQKSRNGSSVPEGRLKLLRRYQLFSTDEVRQMDKLPNAELGSDHFSLLAHFLLT